MTNNVNEENCQNLESLDHIDEWIRLLNGACTIDRVFWNNGASGYVDGHYYCGPYPDGCEDYTNSTWLQLGKTADLTTAIDLFDQIHTYISACKAQNNEPQEVSDKRLFSLFLNMSWKDDSFLIVSPKQWDTFSKKKHVKEIDTCRKNKLHLVIAQEDYQYYDFVSGNTYQIYIKDEWYGAVDCAATYGVLGLRIVD